MIHITDKHNCCGCAACIQACPKQCFSFHTDEDGFAYPIVDVEKCIVCGLCEKVCPFLHQTQSHNPVHVFAAKNPDEAVRMQSSSGGVFSLLAEQIIQEGGVVFGARFNDQWEVIHDYTSTIEGLAAFRGSKYVQSRIGNTYQKAQQFLKEGCKVIFSGTPCQIAGLKLFLRKDYENLLAVECICHGVPSPELWQQYLKEQNVKNGYNVSDIKRIDFRHKVTGWRNYSFSIEYKDGTVYSISHDNNPWIRAFIHNLGLRPSCHDCQCKLHYSQADITLGDLWGAETICPDLSDNKGLSLVVVHTDKAKELLPDICHTTTQLLDSASQYNKAMVESPSPNSNSEKYFAQVHSSFIKTVRKYARDSFVLRCKLFIAGIISKIR